MLRGMSIPYTGQVDSTCLVNRFDMPRKSIRHACQIESISPQCGINMPRMWDRHASNLDSNFAQIFQKTRRIIWKKQG